jgi:hypothetical protein
MGDLDGSAGTGDNQPPARSPNPDKSGPGQDRVGAMDMKDDSRSLSIGPQRQIDHRIFGRVSAQPAIVPGWVP